MVIIFILVAIVTGAISICMIHRGVNNIDIAAVVVGVGASSGICRVPICAGGQDSVVLS